MVKKTKLPIKFVEELVRDIVGSDAVLLVNLIVDKDYISEFKLAEKLKISVNQVRNMLYRLQNYNLVDFIRKKDKKKGWYIYYWIFDLNLAKRLIVENKENKLVYLKKRLEHEKEENYYKCPNDCIRLNSLNSMEHNFTCSECGKILVVEDISKSSKLVRKEIKQLEEDLQELRKEFIIKAKEEKLKEVKEKIKKEKIKRKIKRREKKKKIRVKRALFRKKPSGKKRKKAFLKKKALGKKSLKKKISKKKRASLTKKHLRRIKKKKKHLQKKRAFLKKKPFGKSL